MTAVSAALVRRLPCLRWRAFPLFATASVVMAVVAVACGVFAVRLVGKPFPGFLVYRYPSVGSFAAYDWPGVRAGIRYRDIVERVDGVDLLHSSTLQALVDDVPPGTPVRYELRRDGASIVVEVAVARFLTQDFFALFGLPFLCAAVLSVIGAAVYVLKRDAPAGRVFPLFCFLLGVYLLTGLASQTPPHSELINALNLVGMAFFPAAAVHLSMLFPEPTPLVAKGRRVHLLPYVVSAGLAAALLTDVTILSGGVPDMERFVRVHARLVGWITLARAWAIVAAASLVGSAAWTYWRSHTVITKERARVVLLGCACAFGPPVVAMPLVATGVLVVPFNFFALAVLVFPGAVGYAIARHNLFDVDRYLKRTVGYVIMTGAVGLAYAVTHTAVKRFVLEPVLGRHAEPLYPVLFAVLVVFLFQPLQLKVQRLVDRLFFRAATDYKATIRAVSRALSRMLDHEEIVRQVTDTVRADLFAETAVVVLCDPEATAYPAFVARDGNGLEQREIPADDALVALLRRERRLVTRYEIEEDPGFADVRDPCRASFAAIEASLAVPILNNGAVTAFLALGEKKSGHFYSRDDVDLLDTMADEVGIALGNARAHERVVRYAADLAASLHRIHLLESMKANLSKFVPRTVQDLIERAPGAPLPEKQEVDVSVLFADITGYTRISAELGFEEVNQLVEQYFGAFLDEIVRHGGDVNETAGDGLMVIFQDTDPAAHARAAVNAALGIQRRAREINAASERTPVVMHVGVNSGRASVGVTRIEGASGTRWTYTASGPTTNIAARLAALGEGGVVTISEETRRRIGDITKGELEDIGLQSLKNVATPLRVYRLHVAAYEANVTAARAAA